MNIIILTEAGKNIGLGHLSRCSALYEEAKEREINVRILVNGDYRDHGIFPELEIEYVNWPDPLFVKSLISKEDYVIIDSYWASYKYSWF